jgi:phenylpyruvate tautomerase PptA (4-oxalocrotonate tautomerase family)
MPFVRISLKGSRSEKERQSIGDCIHRAKKALFKNIAEFLAAEQGVRPEDVFINLVETSMENWSFGNGICQYADAPPPHLAK